MGLLEGGNFLYYDNSNVYVLPSSLPAMAEEIISTATDSTDYLKPCSYADGENNIAADWRVA